MSTQVFASAVVTVAVVAINLLEACSYHPPAALQKPADVYAILDAAPYVEPTEGDRWTVLEEPGQLKVEHGWSCAKAPRAASSEYIGLRILEFATLNHNYQGTVFMNGWNLEYAKKDHHVMGLGSTIYNITPLNDKLVWNAGGLVADHNGDDGYEWCYSYTVLSWPKPSSSLVASLNFQPHVDIEAVVADPRAKLMYVDAPGKTKGAVHKIPGTFKTRGKAPRAKLLAGFGMSFTDDDHHLLQIGFDFGNSKINNANKKIRWTSRTILKDNASSRGQAAAEIVSVLRGASVHEWHPSTVVLEEGRGTPGVRSNELSMTPRSKVDCGALLVAPTSKVYSYSIPGIPFTWAVPMLTGWDLSFQCSDNHVTRVGAWIEDFHYQRNPGDAFGTLYYTLRTNLADKNDKPGMLDRVRVDVLGINLLVPETDPGDSTGGGVRPFNGELTPGFGGSPGLVPAGPAGF